MLSASSCGGTSGGAAPSATMCRICAFDSDDTEPLLDASAADGRSEAGRMFTTCLAIELIEPPPHEEAASAEAAAAAAIYPRRICFRCNTQLRMFNEFRRGALRMHQRFTEQVQKRLAAAEAEAEAEAEAKAEAEAEAASRKRRSAETAAVVPIELISVNEAEQKVPLEALHVAEDAGEMKPNSIASGDGDENELLDEEMAGEPAQEPETIGEQDAHEDEQSEVESPLPDVDDAESVVTNVKEEATGDEETTTVATDEDRGDGGEDVEDVEDVEHMDVMYLDDEEMLEEATNDDHDVEFGAEQQSVGRLHDAEDEEEEEDEEDEEEGNEDGAEVYDDEYVPASLAVERLGQRKAARGAAAKAVAVPKSQSPDGDAARGQPGQGEGTGKKGTPCPDCGKTFKRWTNLQKHVCQEETVFTCDQCGVEFPTKQRRDMHASRHTNHRPVPCEFCDKSFKNKYDLKVHHRSHSDLRKYVCPICGNAFRARTHLNNHVESHALENNYPCKFCNQKYKTQITLTRHMVSMHTNKDEFQCAECGKAFGLKFRYERHLKIHQRQRQQRKATPATATTTKTTVVEVVEERAEAEAAVEEAAEVVAEDGLSGEQQAEAVKFKEEEECWVEESGGQYEIIHM